MTTRIITRGWPTLWALALLCGARAPDAGRCAEPTATTGAALAKAAPSTGVRPPYTRPRQPAGLTAKEALAWQKGWALYEDRVRLREGLKGASAADARAAFLAWDQAHAADVAELGRLKREAAPDTAARIGAAAAP
ncbi:MAG TPA: hypothetical protein PLU30_26395 [Verrucomicrobiae bacterium]|nr:hypothetical protein [Verrucomicrobiae bacterium]